MVLVAFAAMLLVQYSPAASEQEKKAAGHTYDACLLSKAQEMDDGVSDAATIAQGVAASCVRQFAAVTEAYQRGMNPQLQLMIAERFRAQEQSGAIQAVLTVREVRRQRH